MNPRRILVTGSTGFIGSRLCELLSLEYCLPYRALVRNFSRAVRIARLNIEMAAGDLADPESLRKAVTGCDAVVNLAHSDDRSARRETASLVAACKQAKVERLVHISSMAVHGPTPAVETVTEANSPIRRWKEVYSDAKAEAERVVADSAKRGDLRAVILRPTIVYGPFSGFVRAVVEEARRGFITLIDNGAGICNAVYVDDVCDAVLAALVTENVNGEGFLINGPSRITWHDFNTTFANLVTGPKAVHNYSAQEVVSHWRARRPTARDTINSVVRLVSSPAFHAQLATVPPVGWAIKTAKGLLAKNVSAEQKAALKTRLLGKRPEVEHGAADKPAMPSPGRVVREAYPAWVCSDLARARLGWQPLHTFEEGAMRTSDWLRVARLI